ncbi:farnesyl pyrophosphate synthase-like [Glandiceps talaboti]
MNEERRNLLNSSESHSSIRTINEGDDAKDFNGLYNELSSTLTERTIDNFEATDAMERFKIVLDYNVPWGKQNRGLTVVASYRHLAEPGQLQERENIKRAMALGWCVELFQAFFLVADDVMDQSQTRRGQPCWYKKGDVGMAAINDASYIQSCIFRILQQYIRDQPYYIDVLELFHETIYQTIVGQSLDMMTAPVGDTDLTRFTQDRYDTIVKWKTAYYSFYLPVALGMYMTGINDKESHEVAKTILLEMGRYFQIQDDYLDCYGDIQTTGKIGTDIADNKCSWLVVQALQRADPSQRLVLQENYGVADEQKIASVKRVYEELNLKKVYQDFEDESYRSLTEIIDKQHGKLPKEMFSDFMSKIYKRNK